MLSTIHGFSSKNIIAKLSPKAMVTKDSQITQKQKNIKTLWNMEWLKNTQYLKSELTDFSLNFY